MSPRPRKRNKKQQRPQQQNRRRRQGGQPRIATSGAGFWGDPTKLPKPHQDVRITEDPSAVARSLGPPPLTGHEAIAEHYFAAVYDRAVTLAGALAAAGELIKPEELVDELAD